MLIGVILSGFGLIIGVAGNYAPQFRQAPIRAPIVNVGVGLAFPGGQIGEGYYLFSAPGTVQVQFPSYPLDASLFGSPSGSSVFIGGYFVASGPINFTITSLVPGSPTVFRMENCYAAGFLVPNPWFPWFFKIEWENGNSGPLLVVGKTIAVAPVAQVFSSVSPYLSLSLGIVLLGLVIFASGFLDSLEREKSKPRVPGNLSEVLDFSLTTWKALFPRVTLLFAVLVSLQILLISIARGVTQLVNFELFSPINPFHSPLHRNHLLLQITTFSIPIIYYLVILLSFLLPLVAEGMVIKYTYDHVTRVDSSLGESLRTAARCSGKLLAGSLVLAMILIAGLAVFVVPGIYLAVVLSLVLQVIVVEGTDVTGGITRSIELTHGRRLETFKLLAFGGTVAVLTIILGYLLAFKLAPTVPTIISPADYFTVASASSLVNSLPSLIGFALIMGTITATTLPLFNIMVTILYYRLIEEKSAAPKNPSRLIRTEKR